MYSDKLNIVWLLIIGPATVAAMGGSTQANLKIALQHEAGVKIASPGALDMTLEEFLKKELGFGRQFRRCEM